MPAAQPPTAHRLTCVEPGSCPCRAHIDPSTYLPCCPRHNRPLAPSDLEPGRGFCPECDQAGAHAHHEQATWVWVHADVFDGDDAPPANGWNPLPMPGAERVTLTITAASSATLAEAVLALHYSDIPVVEVTHHLDPADLVEEAGR